MIGTVVALWVDDPSDGYDHINYTLVGLFVDEPSALHARDERISSRTSLTKSSFYTEVREVVAEGAELPAHAIVVEFGRPGAEVRQR